MNEAALSFLGLLNRGGKLVIGESIEYAMKKGEALVLADTDSKTVTRLLHKAESKGAIVLQGVSKAELGACIGYEQISAILVADGKASKALIQKWECAPKGEL